MMTPIQITARSDKDDFYTAVFTVTDSTYGIIAVPRDGNEKCSFIEYNLNGEEIDRRSFDAPDVDLDENSIFKCEAVRLFDGNFALMLYADDKIFFVKINGRGEYLSEMFTVGLNSLQGYTEHLTDIVFEGYKSGLCTKLYSRSKRTYLFLTLDFKSEPHYAYQTGFYRYFPIDKDTYVICRYVDNKQCLYLCDSSDSVIGEIPIDFSVVGVFEDQGNIVVMNYSYGSGQADVRICADTYGRTGELLSRKEITEAAKQLSGLDSISHCAANDAGYYITVTVPALNSKEIAAFDRDWNYVGTMSIDPNVTPAYVGVCGLIEKTEYVTGRGVVEVVSRFALGDFEIVPKREHLLGDANLDGAVDITDAATIRRCNARMIGLSDTALQLADVDKDGDVCILDATWIQRWELKMKAPEGIGEPL